ncbi:MAG: hypothetical protein JW937_01600 [Candidatus Omnitrophica bacterium]|nr:hypothetical protein [Candidatus Omnitrophota bacterium]
MEKVSIQGYLKELNKVAGRKQRLGLVGPRLGMLMILCFMIVLVPLYVFAWFFNKSYFWIRNQPFINPKPFFAFDRHKLVHLTLVDKLWCEYCEWANGTLHWSLAIANELERRYCPIQNKSPEECERDKLWRHRFLHYDHSPQDLRDYYTERYLNEGPGSEPDSQ